MMNTNTKSRFSHSSRFKSLPDGRRVFLVSYPWTGYYVIPNISSEHQLDKKVSWEIILSLLSLMVSIGTVWVFRDALGKYAFVLFPIISFTLVGIVRWLLYRNELQGLQKTDYPSAVSSSYTELSKNLRAHAENSFPNYEISMLLHIPDSQEMIVMLKYTQPFPNLIRCRLDGSIVWQAEFPSAVNDVYTNVEWKDRTLHAFSRSCRSVVLDEDTGKILSAGLSGGQASA